MLMYLQRDCLIDYTIVVRKRRKKTFFSVSKIIFIVEILTCGEDLDIWNQILYNRIHIQCQQKNH